MNEVPDNVTTLRPRPASRTAFVLGGGGNLGAVQVGMLAALTERGIRPDLVLGCSVGALNGAVIAADPSPGGVARLQEIWLDKSTWQVFSSNKLAGPWLLLRRARSMIGDERLRALAESALAVRTFEELTVPLHVVATSLRTGKARWFDQGPMLEPIIASAALPAIFPPVTIDDDLLIDGGVVDNVPISRAVELGATRIVVLHTGNFERPRPDPQRPLDVLLQAFSIARNERFARESEMLAAGGPEVLIVPGVDPGPLRRDDFTKTSALIVAARASTAAWLSQRVGAATG
jgi:NTE family protein